MNFTITVLFFCSISIVFSKRFGGFRRSNVGRAKVQGSSRSSNYQSSYQWKPHGVSWRSSDSFNGFNIQRFNNLESGSDFGSSDWKPSALTDNSKISNDIDGSDKFKVKGGWIPSEPHVKQVKNDAINPDSFDNKQSKIGIAQKTQNDHMKDTNTFGSCGFPKNCCDKKCSECCMVGLSWSAILFIAFLFVFIIIIAVLAVSIYCNVKKGGYHKGKQSKTMPTVIKTKVKENDKGPYGSGSINNGQWTRRANVNKAETIFDTYQWKSKYPTIVSDGKRLFLQSDLQDRKTMGSKSTNNYYMV